MYKKISGIVIEGNKLAGKLGFKTANLALGKEHIEPGTYKINGLVRGKVLAGIGTSVNGKGVFESHFFDFDGDIYGEKIEVMILYKLRDNHKFESESILIDQIKTDIKNIKKTRDLVLSFGTFDLLHKGHEYYLINSRLYGDQLITIVGTDKNVKKIKGKNTYNSLEKRINNLEKLGISDIIEAGSEDDHLFWLDKYSVNLICLGYDQKGFSESLEKHLIIKGLDIKIIRLKSYKPEEYKSSILLKKICG